MSNRHLIRSIVLQSLFEWDFKEKKDNIDELVAYDINEFAPTIEKDDFLQFLVKGVTRNIKKIDKILKTYAPEWPINQIAILDRNILRIAIFELLYNDATPFKVIINEAIELSKNFGSNNSSKFVNGVLGSVFDNMQKNITNIYEIGLIIKDGDKYFVTNKDEKINFIRFKNDIKEKEEAEEIEKKKKEDEELSELKEENIEKIKVGRCIGEEKITDERLDNNEFITNADEKQKEKELEEKNKKEEHEKRYTDFANKKIKALFKDITYEIKSIGDVNYSIRDENNDSIFPSIIKKNILFVLVNNLKNMELLKGKGIWISEEKLLENIEYKNLKKILKNL